MRPTRAALPNAWKQDTTFPISKLSPVSLFPRVDAALDATLPEHLKGKVAIALAKAAYQDWEQYFGSSEFASLAEKGANRVQLLWASTGVKTLLS